MVTCAPTTGSPVLVSEMMPSNPPVGAVVAVGEGDAAHPPTANDPAMIVPTHMNFHTVRLMILPSRF
jgi:hypothetical protein